jgi:spermidine synthase
MESQFPEQQHTLRFLEPHDSCRQSLWERLFTMTYDKPFIVDDRLQRRLQFDLYTVQSAMHREYPDRLILAYTRKMMAFLLFNRTPARILLLGLGGGSLAKFCYRRLPGSAITAIEVNPDVIALREAFCIPPDDDRFRVLRADAADYLAGLGRSKDVILADACDSEGIASELGTVEFYENVHGDTYERAAQFARIRSVFGKRVIALPVREDGNLIVLAFRTDVALRNWAEREFIAQVLEERFGLNFPRFVRKMSRSPTLTALRALA